MVVEIELVLAPYVGPINRSSHDGVLNCAFWDWIQSSKSTDWISRCLDVQLFVELGLLSPQTLSLCPGFCILRLIHALECTAVRVFDGLGVNESTDVVSGT